MIELLPKTLASKRKVVRPNEHLRAIVSPDLTLPFRLGGQGLGRKEPNAHPVLPEPTGRVSLSLFSPLSTLRQLIGPKLCATTFLARCKPHTCSQES